MLVRLTSSAAGELILFAQHAHALFATIGKECTARGVFTKEQLPEAIERLNRAAEEDKLSARLAQMEAGSKEDPKHEQDEDDKDKDARDTVHLHQRAHPLVRFMELTLKENGFILWEADKDF